MKHGHIVLAGVLAGIVGTASVSLVARRVIAQPQQACLHGPDEAPAEALRRQAALGFTRHVNTAEANQRRGQDFAALSELSSIPAPPDGFKVQLSTDGHTYAFSVKDTLDSCHFAYFSDQDGVIFNASPIR